MRLSTSPRFEDNTEAQSDTFQYPTSGFLLRRFLSKKPTKWWVHAKRRIAKLEIVNHLKSHLPLNNLKQQTFRNDLRTPAAVFVVVRPSQSERLEFLENG